MKVELISLSKNKHWPKPFMLIKKLITSALLFICLFSFRAQTFHFNNFSVKDGLAQSNVSGIVQDSTGFYWIATAGGVSRFDGKNFINYTTEYGLTDNNVSAIFMGRDQILWLGHENGTLTKFDGKTFTEIKSKLLPKDKKIYGFFQEKNGSLWVCTETAGAIRIISPNSEKGALGLKVYSGKDGLSQYVLSATEDKKGDIWFLTDIGLKIYDHKTRSFDFFRPENMPMAMVTFLSRDAQQNLLFGTYNGGVIRYDPLAKSYTTVISPEKMAETAGYITPNSVYTVYEDKQGFLWASLVNVGVVRLNKKTGECILINTSNGISVNKITSITEDREGNIIFGTSGEGIEVFSGERFVNYSKRNGLIDNQVWAICKDKFDRTWFGTNEGVTVYDPAIAGEKAYKNFTTKDGLPSNNIRAITADRSGNLWIATWGGRVVKYDMASSKFVKIPVLNDIVNNFAGNLLVDSKNKLWIGTNEGIVIFDLTTQVVKTLRTIDGLIDNYITAIFEDHKGNYWIGTKQKGVTFYDGEHFKTYNRENGLNYNSISSIGEDLKGRIWLGTEGGGAFVFEDGKFTNYKVKDGLASEFITLIAADKDQNLWLGTNKGLNKFSSSDGKFVTFNQSNGFTGVETKPRAIFRDSEGNMWFGTVNGAYKYSPKKDKPLKVEPLTKLLHFKANNTEYELQRSIKLGYKENSLEFNFVGVSLANPQSVYYKVKLEGFDDEWKNVSTNTAVYANLQPGLYTFKIQSCNSFDVCSSVKSYKITITPPYWKTWWFYLIVLTVLISVLFTYIKVRERTLQEEKRKLETMVNERTAEVVEKNKELDEINKDITASIRYAKRIQDAILPPDDFIKQNLPNTFVLFKPKDIVSGDFYWMENRQGKVIFAAVDCTGHGVPGAFMSIVGHNILDRVVGEGILTEPAKILDELNKGIGETLRQSNLEDNTVRDGMDIAMCALDPANGILQYAGAYNPLWLIRNGELLEMKANKFPIGNSRLGDTNKFTNHELQLQKGDTVYIFSDGYCDQFGGPAGKKFKASAFRQLLLSSQHLSMAEQHVLLDKTIEAWRGNHEQVDDILIIGSRY